MRKLMNLLMSVAFIVFMAVAYTAAAVVDMSPDSYLDSAVLGAASGQTDNLDNSNIADQGRIGDIARASPARYYLVQVARRVDAARFIWYYDYRDTGGDPHIDIV